MSTNDTRRRVRIWPGLAILVLQWLLVFGSGLVAPATAVQFMGMMVGPFVGVLLLVVWWLFGARVPWPERVVGAVALAVSVALAFLVAHRSMTIGIVAYAVPAVSIAFVASALCGALWTSSRRRVLLAIAPLLVAASFGLLRSDGVDGDMSPQFRWRFAPTAEARLLESGTTAPPGRVPALAVGVAEWPGFRGPRRDGVVHDTAVPTDWESAPPQALWRRPVGPGWSSIAVAGDLLYTQEQRGEDELVTCYRASSGEPVWEHRDRARFWEALAGAGPRATPTVAGGRVFTLGATGLLNALDAANGTLLWARDAAADANATVPDWGFAGSPLVADELVIVHTGGRDGRAVTAYDAATGEPRWFAPAGALSYAAPHAATIAGVSQVLMLTGDGAAAFDPTDGRVLWEYAWPMPGGARIVQPAVLDDDSVLIGTGFGMGVRRVAVTHDGGAWRTDERWTSTGVKPYYNDFVVHGDHLYGFDGRIMAAVDLTTGERAWKGGRYGNGQVLLLADQDLLLVLSDRGEVALVEASPAAFAEVARFQAIAGKTWNHPVLVDGVLYVRNGETMAAFGLEGRPAVARRPSSN